MRASLVATAGAVLVAALSMASADAATTRHRDDVGRVITIDARAKGVDAAGYARILARAVHGDEIDDVVIRVVPRARIMAECDDPKAVACYVRSSNGAARVVVPALAPGKVGLSLLHEYGHHVDATGDAPRWWRARGMQKRLSAGTVAWDYSLGWEHAVGEIFSEDYVALHVRGASLIRWMPAPSAKVLTALQRDITGRVAPLPDNPLDPATDPGTPQGTLVTRTLDDGAAGAGQVIRRAFVLPAAGGRVVATARPALGRDDAVLTVVLSCDGWPPSEAQGAPGGGVYTALGPVQADTACAAEVRGPDARAVSASLEVAITTSD